MATLKGIGVGGGGRGGGGGGGFGRTKKDNKQHANLRPPEQYKANARTPSFKGPVSIKTKTNKQKNIRGKLPAPRDSRPLKLALNTFLGQKIGFVWKTLDTQV